MNFSFVFMLLKPIGLLEICNVLSKAEYFLVEEKVANYLRSSIEDDVQFIFERALQLHLIDKSVLKSGLNSYGNGAFLLVVLTIFSRLFIFPLKLIYLFILPRRMWLSIKGDFNGDHIVYTNDIHKSVLSNILVDKKVMYLYLSDTDVGGESITARIELRDYISCIKVMFRLNLIDPRVVIRAIISLKLFDKFFSNCSVDLDHVFIREGASPNERALLHCAHKHHIKSTVILEHVFSRPGLLYPSVADVFLVPSVYAIPDLKIKDKFKIYSVNSGNSRNLLLNSRNQPCASSPKGIKIGLLVGDELNRWGDQKLWDHNVLNILNAMGCFVYIRPHPQELRRKERLSYYSDLSSKYDNVEINQSSIYEFLDSVCGIVSYSHTTMIYKCFEIGKPFCDYSVSEDFYVNELPRVKTKLYFRANDEPTLQSFVGFLCDLSVEEKVDLRDAYIKDIYEA